MGREHRIIVGLAALGRAGGPGARVLRRPDVNGAPFYVMGFVDGHVLRDRADGGGALPRRGPAHRQRVARRHDGRHPRRRPRRGRPRRPRPPRRLHRPPAEALVRPVEPRRRRASCRPSTRSTTLLLGPHPRAGPGDHRPRRLPPRQLHGRRRRRGRRGARLGDLHARRPAGRRRPAAGVLDRARRRAVGAGAGIGHHGARVPATAPTSSPATPRSPAAISRSSTSTSRSRSGSWRASSRACTPATSPGRSVIGRDPGELDRSAGRSERPRRRRPPSIAGRLAMTRARTSARSTSPSSTRPVLVVMLHGLDRRRRARQPRGRHPRKRARHHRARRASTATPSSTTAPADR